MRNRKLSRREALQEYLVYQIRIYEYLHTFQVGLEIFEKKYRPENPLGHGGNEFFGTFRTQSFGMFASLMDPTQHALNVFDVWVNLYPDETERIRALWEKIRPNIHILRAFRNDVAAHVNKNLGRYFSSRERMFECKELIAAMQEFWQLSADLIKKQAKAMPNFREEIDPILRKALHKGADDDIEELKDYFIQS